MTAVATNAEAALAPVLHIGVLTYNGLHHTQRCVDSLRVCTRQPWRLVIRDNCSTDATPEYLHGLDDARITTHCAQENLGVGGGRNWLLGSILEHAAPDDLIVLLDNDIEVNEGWEVPFVEAFAAQPTLGVAGRWAFSMRVHEAWRDVFNENTASSSPADTVQGCVFWLRVSTARQVGSFDESLGRFWHEDDDYSVRALAAGWDVQRVAGGGITHHEHGSGVALHPDKVLGSARNQQQLVSKWRSLQMISEAGLIKRPHPDEQEALRTALSQRLGRLIVRSELNSALTDMATLMHGAPDDVQLAVHCTPLVQLLLADVVQHANEYDGGVATSVLGHVSRITSERRRSAPVLPALTAVSSPDRALNGVCTPAVWDSAHWYDELSEMMHDGTGVDYYSRSERAWRDGQLLQALRAVGVRKSSRVLVVGHGSERLTAAITHLTGTVVVADTELTTAAKVQGSGSRAFGDAALHCAQWPLVEREEYDAVLCPNAGRYAPPERWRDLLMLLARHTRRGGLVSVAASVRISGSTSAKWLELSTLADDASLHEASLRRIGTMNTTICDEVLLAAVPRDAPATWRPMLSRLENNRVITLASVAARKV